MPMSVWTRSKTAHAFTNGTYNEYMWFTLVIFQPWNVCFPADGKVAFLGWNTYLSQ